MNTSTLRLIAARVLVGASLERRLDQVLEIDGGVLAAVRPRTAADHGDGDGVVDLGDVTVLPGLIDAHQHLVFDASLDPVAAVLAADDEALAAHMRAAASRALAAGITTIRDLGDRGYLSLDLRDRILRGDETGPRIVASGPPITTPQGHCWFLGGEVGPGDDLRAAVRERVERGVDVVKVMASGGVLTPSALPHESQLGAAELAVVVAEAHAAGLPVAVHAHGTQAIVDAVEAGADSIEHCTFMTEDGVDDDDAAVAALAAAGCAISTTTASLPGRGPSRAAMAARLSAIRELHARLQRAGARVVCSSDAGIGPNKPHDVLPHGVTDVLAGLGLTNAEAIRNVTAVAAEVCRVADRTGTIEPGKDADLLVVAGDPLDDLAAIHEVVGVYARGRRA